MPKSFFYFIKIICLLSTVLANVDHHSDANAGDAAQSKSALAPKIVTCPVIDCDTTIGEFVCFQHASDVPVTSIQTFFCPNDRVCNL